MKRAWSSSVSTLSRSTTQFSAMSSPASLQRLPGEAVDILKAGQPVPMQSSRTGQSLAIGPAWLQEQLEDPDGHHLPARVGDIVRPIGLIHGTDDPTVDPADAVTLAQANPSRSQVRLIEGGDHVFNTPNPFPATGAASPQLEGVLEVVTAWGDSWIA